MAIRSFSVTSYTIKLGDKLSASFGGTTIKARAVVSCIGSDNQRVVAYFLADDSPVPTPTTTIGGKWGPVFLPKELLGQWTDMLRNEKPLYGYINTDHPEWTNVSTSSEPVGEEET
jgi:hypothetical protein